MNAHCKWVLHRWGTWEIHESDGFPRSSDYSSEKPGFRGLYDSTLKTAWLQGTTTVNSHPSPWWSPVNLLSNLVRLWGGAGHARPSPASDKGHPRRLQGHVLRGWKDISCCLWQDGCLHQILRERQGRPCIRAGAVRSSMFLLGVKHICRSPPVWLLFLSFNCFQTRDGWKGGAVYHIRTPACCRRQWAGRFAQFKWDSGISACPFQSQSPLPSEIHRLLYTIPSIPQGL